MINQDQIEEWIHEVEGRPSSAPLIIRYIANRLRELSGRNEELLAENIELRTGRKVEDYEGRIASLVYQLDLLKRQLGSGGSVNLPAPIAETVSFIIYTPKGRIIRLETAMDSLVSGHCIASLPANTILPRLVATSPAEELLFVFDSGRTTTLPVSEIPEIAPEGTSIAWEKAFLVEPHGGEELVNILPVARMSLYDCCVQTSRRGCAKKMMKSSFESHVTKSYIGAGVKGKPDKTFNLTLCGKDDLLVLTSREGFAWCLDVNQLPYTIEEVLKLSTTDYLSASFAINQAAQPGEKSEKKPSILFLTHNGKVIHREIDWLEKPASYKSRGQQVFTQARRDAGVRIISAAAVNENDWGVALSANGRLTVHSIAGMLEAGALSLTGAGSSDQPDILEFISFCVPGTPRA